MNNATTERGSRRTVFWLCTVVGLAVALPYLIIASNLIEMFDWWRLTVNRRETSIARPLAEKLMLSDWGVRRALADMNVFGGTTKGWSSWIVQHSDKRELNDLLLKKSEVGEDGVRIEALWLLWKRTKDVRHLLHMLESVREPGGAVTGLGRRKLATEVTDQSIRSQILLPEQQKLTVDPAELRENVITHASPHSAGAGGTVRVCHCSASSVRKGGHALDTQGSLSGRASAAASRHG